MPGPRDLLPPLDFSFCDLSTCEDILTVPPRHGRVIARAPGLDTKTTAPAVLPEEHVDDDDAAPDHRFGAPKPLAPLPPPQTAAPVGPRYACRICRLNDNRLADLGPLCSVLQSIIPKASSSLTALDLSNNRISALPGGLSRLPLRSLYLHTNLIATTDEIGKLAPVTTLTTLTLHGNPVVVHTRHYRPHILWLLPGLKALDFAAVTRGDRETVETFVRFFQPGAPKPKPKPPRLR